MGIIDALRKKKGLSKKEIRHNKFMGDLANISEPEKNIREPEKNETAETEHPIQQECGDSHDSVVILSFLEHAISGWVCLDCGTTNPPRTNSCEVCGFVRQ